MDVMSVAEMREILKVKIDSIPDEYIEKAFERFNAIMSSSIDEIYNDAVLQYGDTLRKLAQ